LETGQALGGESRSVVYVKKRQRDRLIRLAQSSTDFAYGFEDEVWWSRAAPPALHAWTTATPLRLQQKQLGKEDPEAKALACYGFYVPADNQMLLRFVADRPISTVTCTYLAWLAGHFTAKSKRALFLLWDNASWHISKEVSTWLKLYNRRAKRQGHCRLIVCRLPSKSPWLNPIEPKWLHGKRAIVEPARTLSIAELMERICAYYQCDPLDLIAK
jgi:hypothetical protein